MRRRTALYVAAILIGFVITYGLEHRDATRRIGDQRKALVASCERGNRARLARNAKAAGERAEARALVATLDTAIMVRLADGSPASLKAAKRYREIAVGVKAVTAFPDEKLVDCEQVYPKV